MKVLVIGNGGREHALAWKAAQSPLVETVFVAPGNAGTALEPALQNVAIGVTDIPALLDFAQNEKVDLTIVGPEAPLVAGVADVLREAGVAVFGPDAQGAQLEGSKTYSKEFMEANGIPTARYGSFTELEPALAYVHELGAPVVVKADGLAAGKGVVVADTIEVAEDAVRSCFDGAFGSAGSKVVVEECLTGPECSLLAFVSGGKAHCMATAQDHKRAFDGDRGPNTGGMGAFAPSPLYTRHIAERTEREILLPTLRAMNAEGFTFKGVLYVGLMLTKDGPKVVEYNARFGDPETQVVLPLLDSDLFAIMRAVREQRLAEMDIRWKDGAAACVVLASGGYPGKYEGGKPISGLEEAEAMGATVYHAGTKRTDAGYVTAGGRVLGVTALGDTLADAIHKAYAAAEQIHFDGAHMRRDIGKLDM